MKYKKVNVDYKRYSIHHLKFFVEHLKMNCWIFKIHFVE